jgi:hypothetical protein
VWRLIAALALAFVAQTAVAQEMSDWHFSVSPYAWLTNVSGSLSAQGHTVDVNAGLGDLFAKTDTLVALMANLEARHDRWRLGLDVVYTQMVFTPSVAAQRNPVPWLNLSAAAGASVQSTLLIIEGSAAYELAHLDDATTIEGLVGVRYWHAVTDMNFGFTATGTINTPGDAGLSRSGGLAVAGTGSMDWADPIVGAQLWRDLAPHHRLRLRGDIGGGIGSQFTWQAFAGYSYEFSPGPTAWAATLGYRALGLTYGAGSGADSRSLNLVMHGPVLGVSYRF